MQRRRQTAAANSILLASFLAFIFHPSLKNTDAICSSCGRTTTHQKSNLERSASVFAVQAFGRSPSASAARGANAFLRNAFLRNRHRRCIAQSIRRRPSSIKVASYSAETTCTQIHNKKCLEDMTVKQLKLYIQDNNIQIPRGEASNLKLKKQIVDFIWNHRTARHDGISAADQADLNSFIEANGSTTAKHSTQSTTEASEVNASATKKRKQRVGGGMPPLPDPDKQKDNSQPYILTPKDRIVLDVLDIYPPLHAAILEACAQEDNIDLPIGSGITASNIEHCGLRSLNYQIPTGIGENDIRHAHHPMLRNVTQTDMDLVFLGTASCSPGTTRGVSCTAVRFNWRSGKTFEQGRTRTDHVEERGPKGGTWIFDCGEGTQLSVQRTSSVKPGKITKIFVTHCHGDHSFGLPGLLCLMGTDRARDAPPVEIYGPEGLRMWLRVAIRYSVSRVVPPYRVHEIMDVPMAPEWEEGGRKRGRFFYQLRREKERKNRKDGTFFQWKMQGLAGEDPSSWISRAPMMNLEASSDFGEVEGGREIYPRYDHPKCADGAPVWEVEEEEDVSVHAAPMSHGVPCVGYVVTEQDRPGRLQPENVLPVIERNRQGLIDAGIRHPMKVMAMVKNLPVGGTYTFPDGTILNQKDVVEQPRKGRKIVICGDTADSRALEGLARDADVVVHEATNTFLFGIDKDGDVRLATRDAKIHGHSTPFMAGNFARRIRAKKLVLNHFSARYKGDQSIDSLTVMTRMERQAVKTSKLPENSVAAAWDFMVLPVSARNE